MPSSGRKSRGAAPCAARAARAAPLHVARPRCCVKTRANGTPSRRRSASRATGCCSSSRCTARTSRSRGAEQTAGWPRPEADVIVTDDPVRGDWRARRRLRAGAAVRSGQERRRRRHAGWRGTAAGAVAAAAARMKTDFGCAARDLIAAIGPCLGRCCGEVGPEVVEAFRAGGAGARRSRVVHARERRSIVSRSRAREPRSARARRVSIRRGSSRQGCARRRTTSGCTPIAATVPPRAGSWPRFARSVDCHRVSGWFSAAPRLRPCRGSTGDRRPC